MRTLEGTRALITGGSRGIGRAICLRLAAEGADIVFHYHRNQLDFLINNAGIWKGTPLGTSPPELIDEMLDTNLKGPFWVTQCALPLLQQGGRIVNISSAARRIGGAGGRSLYGATKAGIDSLTKSWALELAPRNILVNAVAPGYITTDMPASHLSDVTTFKRAIDRHPLGRLGTAEHVADVVAFLCSHDARFITG